MCLEPVILRPAKNAFHIQNGKHRCHGDEENADPEVLPGCGFLTELGKHDHAEQNADDALDGEVDQHQSDGHQSQADHGLPKTDSTGPTIRPVAAPRKIGSDQDETKQVHPQEVKNLGKGIQTDVVEKRKRADQDGCFAEKLQDFIGLMSSPAQHHPTDQKVRQVSPGIVRRQDQRADFFFAPIHIR